MWHDPVKMLNYFHDMLNDTGGLRDYCNIDKFFRLVKEKKTMVAKNICILILMKTTPDVLKKFLNAGGSELLQHWLEDSWKLSHSLLSKDILKILVNASYSRTDQNQLKDNHLTQSLRKCLKNNSDNSKKSNAQSNNKEKMFDKEMKNQHLKIKSSILNQNKDNATIQSSRGGEAYEGIKNDFSNKNVHKTDEIIQKNDFQKLSHHSTFNLKNTLSTIEPQLQCDVFEKDSTTISDLSSKEEMEKKIYNDNSNTLAVLASTSITKQQDFKNVSEEKHIKLPIFTKFYFKNTLNSMEPQLQCTFIEKDGTTISDLLSEEDTQEKISIGNSKTQHILASTSITKQQDLNNVSEEEHKKLPHPTKSNCKSILNTSNSHLQCNIFENDCVPLVDLLSEKETKEIICNDNTNTLTVLANTSITKQQDFKNVSEEEHIKLPIFTKFYFKNTLNSMEPQLQCTVIETDGTTISDLLSEEDTQEKISIGNSKTQHIVASTSITKQQDFINVSDEEHKKLSNLSKCKSTLNTSNSQLQCNIFENDCLPLFDLSSEEETEEIICNDNSNTLTVLPSTSITKQQDFNNVSEEEHKKLPHTTKFNCKSTLNTSNSQLQCNIFENDCLPLVDLLSEEETEEKIDICNFKTLPLSNCTSITKQQDFINVSDEEHKKLSNLSKCKSNLTLNMSKPQLQCNIFENDCIPLFDLSSEEETEEIICNDNSNTLTVLASTSIIKQQDFNNVSEEEHKKLPHTTKSNCKSTLNTSNSQLQCNIFENDCLPLFDLSSEEETEEIICNDNSNTLTVLASTSITKQQDFNNVSEEEHKKLPHTTKYNCKSTLNTSNSQLQCNIFENDCLPLVDLSSEEETEEKIDIGNFKTLPLSNCTSITKQQDFINVSDEEHKKLSNLSKCKSNLTLNMSKPQLQCNIFENDCLPLFDLSSEEETEEIIYNGNTNTLTVLASTSITKQQDFNNVSEEEHKKLPHTTKSNCKSTLNTSNSQLQCNIFENDCLPLFDLSSEEETEEIICNDNSNTLTVLASTSITKQQDFNNVSEEERKKLPHTTKSNCKSTLNTSNSQLQCNIFENDCIPLVDLLSEEETEEKNNIGISKSLTILENTSNTKQKDFKNVCEEDHKKFKLSSNGKNKNCRSRSILRLEDDNKSTVPTKKSKLHFTCLKNEVKTDNRYTMRLSSASSQKYLLSSSYMKNKKKSTPTADSSNRKKLEQFNLLESELPNIGLNNNKSLLELKSNCKKLVTNLVSPFRKDENILTSTRGPPNKNVRVNNTLKSKVSRASLNELEIFYKQGLKCKKLISSTSSLFVKENKKSISPRCDFSKEEKLNTHKTRMTQFQNNGFDKRRLSKTVSETDRKNLIKNMTSQTELITRKRNLSPTTDSLKKKKLKTKETMKSQLPCSDFERLQFPPEFKLKRKKLVKNVPYLVVDDKICKSLSPTCFSKKYLETIKSVLSPSFNKEKSKTLSTAQLKHTLIDIALCSKVKKTSVLPTTGFSNEKNCKSVKTMYCQSRNTREEELSSSPKSKLKNKKSCESVSNSPNEKKLENLHSNICKQPYDNQESDLLINDLLKDFVDAREAIDKIKSTSSENEVSSSTSYLSLDLIGSPSLSSTDKSPSFSKQNMSEVTTPVLKKNATLEPVLVTNVKTIAVKSSQLECSRSALLISSTESHNADHTESNVQFLSQDIAMINGALRVMRNSQMMTESELNYFKTRAMDRIKAQTPWRNLDDKSSASTIRMDPRIRKILNFWKKSVPPNNHTGKKMIPDCLEKPDEMECIKYPKPLNNCLNNSRNRYSVVYGYSNRVWPKPISQQQFTNTESSMNKNINIPNEISKSSFNTSTIKSSNSYDNQINMITESPSLSSAQQPQLQLITAQYPYQQFQQPYQPLPIQYLHKYQSPFQSQIPLQIQPPFSPSNTTLNSHFSSPSPHLRPSTLHPTPLSPSPSPYPQPTIQSPLSTTKPPLPTTQIPFPTTQPPLPTIQPPLPTTKPPLSTTQPPLYIIKPPLPTTKPPLPTTKLPLPTTQLPLFTTQPPLPTTQPPLPIIKPPLPTTKPPLPTTKPPLPTTQLPLFTTQPPLPTTQIPLPTTQPPLPTIQPPLPTTKLPLSTTQLPLPTIQPPLPTTKPPLLTTQPPLPIIKPPLPTTQIPLPTTQPPLPTIQPPLPTTKLPLSTTQLPLPTIQPPLPTTKPPLLTTQPPLPIIKPPLPTTQSPLLTTQFPLPITQPHLPTTKPTPTSWPTTPTLAQPSLPSYSPHSVVQNNQWMNYSNFQNQMTSNHDSRQYLYKYQNFNQNQQRRF